MANQPIRVKLGADNIQKVRLGAENKQKIIASAAIKNNFTDLSDVEIDELTINNDNYVVVYSNTLGKFTIVNPDTVLSAASSTTGPQPGLPIDFVNQLDIDLDNKIDVDAGFF
jgi:hypothetical protein